MKKLNAEDFQEIKIWFHRNARPLELALWQFHFENGSISAVLCELSYYQNTDGGFGNALEPDNWNPESTPYTTLHAINILKSIHMKDMDHPIMKGLFHFLESGISADDAGWRFTISSNDDYPHAPWWTYSPEANITEGVGLTAELCAFVFNEISASAELYKRAYGYCGALLDRLASEQHFGDMGIGGYCILLEALKANGMQYSFDLISAENRLRHLVYDSIERDMSKWAVYGVRPSNYITSPKSVYYQDNKEIVEAELDYLADTRPLNGVWDIPWNWFENNEKYQKEFAIAENWWRAIKAIEKLGFLKNFGRFDMDGTRTEG